MPSASDIWLVCALTYLERFGFSLIPMGDEKKPLIKWAEFQDRRPTVNEVLSWPRQNLAIITGAISGICVIDCESPEDARWFYDNRLNVTQRRKVAIVQTKRGFHLYFRHPGERVQNTSRVPDELDKPRYDVRGDGGYVLAPPSRHSEGQYVWKNVIRSVSDLPAFDPAWRPITKYSPRETDSQDNQMIRDGVAYISRIKAVEGQGGNRDTYRAACFLFASGLSESEALLALQQWNQTNADPPWNDKQLLQKIQSAFRSAQ